ncbi:flagellar biosynthetic protein FliR [Solicola sp. PLA-1-18]|uniref:flagellar biosynthetic protein FliR n=1 Tax=Solicola sp. PLA-1-18 TaxID=3380532 RepID=UPI003B79EBCC
MGLTVEGAPLVAYVLASVRIVAWLVLVPPYASRSFPTQAKVLLALALSFVVVPSTELPTVPTGTLELAVQVAQEVLVGASLGFVTYLVFAAVQAAGDLIDVFGGFSLAAAYDPLSFQMNSVFGRFYQMLATTLLFTTGLHLWVMAGLLKTFDRLPVGMGIDVSNLSQIMLGAFGAFITCAVQIALPIMGVLFVADLGLALLTKVAPQLNAIGIMFPAKIGLTLVVVGFSFTVFPEALANLKDMALEAMWALT